MSWKTDKVKLIEPRPFQLNSSGMKLSSPFVGSAGWSLSGHVLAPASEILVHDWISKFSNLRPSSAQPEGSFATDAEKSGAP